MKSGPTFADATRWPRSLRAARRPVATVVLPTPEEVPATTTRGPSLMAPPGRRRSVGRSILDALLGADPFVVGVLDLAHLGDRVGDLDQLGRRVAAGDDHVGLGRPAAHPSDDLLHRHPAVLHGIGELVEDEQVVVT